MRDWKNKWDFEYFEKHSMQLDEYGIDLIEGKRFLFELLSFNTSPECKTFLQGIEKGIQQFYRKNKIDVDKAVVNGFPVYLSIEEQDIYDLWFAVKMIQYKELDEFTYFLNVHRQYYNTKEHYALYLKGSSLSRLQMLQSFYDTSKHESWLFRYINTIVGVDISYKDQVVPKKKVVKADVKSTKRGYENPFDKDGRLTVGISLDELREYFSILTENYADTRGEKLPVFSPDELNLWIRSWFSFGDVPHMKSIAKSKILTKATWRYVFKCLYDKLDSKYNVRDFAIILMESVALFQKNNSEKEINSIMKHFTEPPIRCPEHIKNHFNK